MSARQQSVRRARRQPRGALRGFVVTWDVDSRDGSACARLRRFVYGYATRKGARTYRYEGFLQRDGVRYLGQSVLFVPRSRLDELLAFLRGHGIAHVATEAALGATYATQRVGKILPNWAEERADRGTSCRALMMSGHSAQLGIPLALGVDRGFDLSFEPRETVK